MVSNLPPTSPTGSAAPDPGQEVAKQAAIVRITIQQLRSLLITQGSDSDIDTAYGKIEDALTALRALDPSFSPGGRLLIESAQALFISCEPSNGAPVLLQRLDQVSGFFDTWSNPNIQTAQATPLLMAQVYATSLSYMGDTTSRLLERQPFPDITFFQDQALLGQDLISRLISSASSLDPTSNALVKSLEPLMISMSNNSGGPSFDRDQFSRDLAEALPLIQQLNSAMGL